MAGFYDAFAPRYHLIFADWDATIANQGEALGRIIAPSGRGTVPYSTSRAASVRNRSPWHATDSGSRDRTHRPAL